MFRLIVFILMIVGLASCEKEDFEPKEPTKIGLPYLIKGKEDVVKMYKKVKSKNKRKKIFLKKNLTTAK